MNFKPLGKNDKVEAFAMVKRCEVKTSSKGAKYLDLILADKDGEIVAKYWDYADGVTPDFPETSIVKVRGQLNEFKGTTQLRVELIRPSVPRDEVNPSDFVKSAEYRADDMYNEICKYLNQFKDEDLKKLTLSIYEDYHERLLYYPAAVKLHHAMRSGLLYHSLSIIKMAEKLCDVYPFVDKDLLIAGAALHDIGKTVEIESNDLGVATEYSVDGNLIGHLVRGAMIVNDTGKKLGIPEDKIRLIEHMLLSHHGNPEFGAAVRPMFLEANILSMLDEMDARIYEISDVTSQVEVGSFSQRQWALDDVRLYNHGRTEIKPKANLLEE